MNLTYRQDKIKTRRAKTDFRDFLMEIASWYPVNIYKNNGMISPFPPTDRCGNLTNIKDYIQNHNDKLDGVESPDLSQFLFEWTKLFQNHIKPVSVQFGDNHNADYGNCIFRAKNVYLSFIVGESSDTVCYSSIVYQNCTNVYDSIAVTNNSTNVYSSNVVTNSFNVFFSQYIHNSSDVRYSNNLIGCHNCINCSDLENCSYYINNIQKTKEEYEECKRAEITGKIISVSKSIGINRASTNVQGQGILQSSDIENGYNLSRLNRGRNVCYVDGVNGCEDFYDVFEVGINSSNMYGVCNAGTNTHYVYNSSLIDQGCSMIFYSYHLESCSFCLGCIGLKNKSYCILNKQYSKEERYEKVDEIFGEMEANGTLGEFFPASMNPFYFNDTAAYLIDPSFTKEEIVARGYLWRDEPIKVDIPEGAQTVTVDELASYESRVDNIRTIDESICKKVILDHEGNAYRIIPMELEFLRKHGLPLPRKHWLDRMKENFRIS